MNDIAQIFENSLNKNDSIRKNAEVLLLSIKIDESFMDSIFQFIHSHNCSSTVKNAAIIFLKNYIYMYSNSTSDEAKRNPEKVLSDKSIEIFKNHVLNIIKSKSNNFKMSFIFDCIIAVYERFNGYLLIWNTLVSDLCSILLLDAYEISNPIYKLIAKV